MTASLPSDATNPYGDQLRTWLTVAHNPDGTQKTAGSSFLLIPFWTAGTLTTRTGTARYPLPLAAAIIDITLACNTAPTGASIVCDVNKNGVTMFTTQANRPTISATGYTSSPATPDVTALTVGDYLSVDIDQVGSTVAGADLTVIVRLQ